MIKFVILCVIIKDLDSYLIKLISVLPYKRGTGPEAEAKIKRVRRRCVAKAKMALSGKLECFDKIFLNAKL